MSEERETLIKRLKAEGFSDEQIEKILLALKGKVSTSQLVTRISPTGRGALFRLKRAFYAVVASEKADVKRSAEYWKEFAGKIIEAANTHNIQDVPCRIKLEYSIIIDAEGIKFLKPIAATIEVYDKVKEIKVI